MSRTAVGIYISARYVDIVEISGSPHSPHLLNSTREEILPFSENEMKEGSEDQAPSQDPIALAIKEGLEKLKIKVGTAYTVLPSNDVMIRYFDMPPLPKAERARGVRYEARKYIPFKIEDIVSDFKILSAANAEKTMGVFFIAATKKRLDSYAEIFKKAGISAIGMDIIPFALIRMLLLSNRIQIKDSVIIVHIDNDKETVFVNIVEMGLPFLSRDFKIQTDDKEVLFEKLASELRLSLDYYHRQRPNIDVSKIIICAEKVFVNLDAFISDELKIITETLEDLEGVRGAEKSANFPIIAIGAALEGLGAMHYSVNLSPLAAAIKKKKIANILAFESIIALIIIVAAFLFSGFLIKGVSVGLSTIKERAGALPPNTSGLSIAELEYNKGEKLKNLNFFQIMVNDRIFWTDKLDRIAKDLPEGTWINKISAGEELITEESGYPLKFTRNITITGASFSPDSSKESSNINSFLKSIKEDKIFKQGFENIELGSVNKKEIGNHQITLFRIFAYSGENPKEKKPQAGTSKWKK